MTGARTFLIAYNVNLLCTKELAHRIALNIREQGRGADQVPREHGHARSLSPPLRGCALNVAVVGSPGA